MKKLFILLIPFISFSQNDSFNNLKKLPRPQFEKAVNDSILRLESFELLNFLKSAEENDIDLNEFNQSIFTKYSQTDQPFQLFNLLQLLINQKTNQTSLEKVLSDKKYIWDKGEWSDNFWKIIVANKLKVSDDPNFTIDKNGDKHYNLIEFLNEQRGKGFIGENPGLFVNYLLINYANGQLLKELNKLDIRDIQVIEKEKSISLYGQRGKDGVLQVLVR